MMAYGVSNLFNNNLFTYCANAPIDNVDHTGAFYIPRWLASMSLDILIWKYAGPFAASWGWQTAPIKFMSKNLVKNWFKNKFAPVIISGFINPILTTVRKVILEVCKVAISGMLSAAISTFLSRTLWEHIDILLSLGGFIAGFLDYVSDKRIDQKITIPFL